MVSKLKGPSKTMAATLALIVSGISSPGHAELITTHDLEIGLVGYGGYKIYRAYTANGSFSPAMNRELQAAASELANYDANIARLQSEANIVEAGEPNVRTRSIYTGKFSKASVYKSEAASAQARASNEYRLQPDGAQRLAQAILEESKGHEGDIRVTMDRVNGTQDGAITMAEAIRAKGTPEQITKALVDAAKAQDPQFAMKSIVGVSIEFDLPRVPDAARAATMRSEAANLKNNRTGIAQNAAAQEAKIRSKYAAEGLAVRRQVKFSVAAIAGAVALFWVRDSFAQGMINMAHACSDEAALRTHATGWSIQTGENVENVYRRAQELCAR